jgi:hypothetical protein
MDVELVFKLSCQILNGKIITRIKRHTDAWYIQVVEAYGVYQFRVQGYSEKYQRYGVCVMLTYEEFQSLYSGKRITECECPNAFPDYLRHGDWFKPT